MHLDPQEFLGSIASLLAWYYLACAGGNLVAAWNAAQGKGWLRTACWMGFAAGFSALAAFSFGGQPPELPTSIKAMLDGLLGPVTLTVGSMAAIVAMFLGRSSLARPAVAWTLLNGSLLFLGLSLSDYQFAQITLRPDNVPIVAMIFLLGFFLWLGASQAVENDRRLRHNQTPVEKEYSESTLVWPDLVYIELICMVIVTVGLVVWSIVLRAPLEQPANPVVTPNPSKAPWYFLGLQEMLVYFDPSIAGVILPTLIILGLAAIPYLDASPRGNGYYTVNERRPVVIVFLFGFALWILLILIGVFFRGPNWTFFGLYEARDPHKLLVQSNVKLSEYFWVLGLGRSMPQAPAGSGTFAQLATILWREIAGVVVLAAYFVGLPILLGGTAMRRYRRQMGRSRYWIMMLLLLMMLALPLKMVLRWSFNLSYLLSVPEYFLSF